MTHESDRHNLQTDRDAGPTFIAAYLKAGLPAAAILTAAIQLLAPVFSYPRRSPWGAVAMTLVVWAPIFALHYRSVAHAGRSNKHSAAEQGVAADSGPELQ